MKFKKSIKFPIIGRSCDFEEITGVPIMANYIRTAFDGSIVELCDYQTKYENWDCKAISFEEALSPFENNKKKCGDCIYYNINGFCIHTESIDSCADRDSHHTCDINSFVLKK
jgi:hypothetical protein